MFSVELDRVLEGVGPRDPHALVGETFAGHPGLEQTVRLEENLLVTKDGPVLFTKYPFDEEALS